MHFLPQDITENNRLTVHAIPVVNLPGFYSQESLIAVERTKQGIYLEISPNTTNSERHNLLIKPVSGLTVIDDKTGKTSARNDVNSKEVERNPLHGPIECIASKKDAHSEEVQGKLSHLQECVVPDVDVDSREALTVHMPKVCIITENATVLGQEQNIPIQGGSVLENYTNQMPSEARHIHIPIENNVSGTFSWNAETEPIHVPQDEPELIEPDDDDADKLSMYCDDNETLTGASKHEGFHCDNCKGDIVGFRYTCVQCSNLDLCVKCESDNAHSHHYMLRVPSPRPYNEIQNVLVRIRRHLMRELDPISRPDVGDEDAISVKSDVKSENEGFDFENEDEETFESIPHDVLNHDSRIFSPTSEGSKDEDYVEVPQDGKHSPKRVKILNINQAKLIETVNAEKSPKPPSTAKRKITLSLAEFLALNRSNEAAKKIRLMPPSTGTKEINVNPTILSHEDNAFKPVVKLSKMPLVDTSNREQIDKEIRLIPPSTGTKEVNVNPTTSSHKDNAFQPVVKLSKMPSVDTSNREQIGKKIRLKPVSTRTRKIHVDRTILPQNVFKPIVRLRNMILVEKSNHEQIAKKKRLMPSTENKELDGNPKHLSPETNPVKPVVKLSKRSLTDTSNQEEIVKRLHLLLSNKAKEMNIDTKYSLTKADSNFNPVVKLTKLPPSLFKQQPDSVQVCSLSKQQNTTITSANS